MCANTNLVGDRRMPVLRELNERATLTEVVLEAVNEMESDTSSGLVDFPVECVQKVGIAVLEW